VPHSAELIALATGFVVDKNARTLYRFLDLGLHYTHYAIVRGRLQSRICEAAVPFMEDNQLKIVEKINAPLLLAYVLQVKILRDII